MSEHKRMSAVEWLLPHGRVGKGKYCLLAFVSLFAFAIIWYVVDSVTRGKGQFAESMASIIALVMIVGWLWFNLAITAKRFHDLNLSGWLAPAIFIPIVFVILCILSGTNGPNKYGSGN